MAFAIEGFKTVAQNWISKGVASNFYKKVPLLAVLAAASLGVGNQNKNDGLSIGRPNSGEILSAKKLSPAEKLNLQGINSYVARIQQFKTNNTTPRSTLSQGRTTAPTVANPTTNSHGQATQAAAEFRWTHIDTPCLIWHEDKDRAGQKETKKGQGLAMAQVIDEATEIAMQDHVDWIADAVWSGNPSNQDGDPWDSCLGLTQMLSASNTYGRVDRSVESNSVWRSNVVTSLTAANIRKIVDYVNIDLQLSALGAGVNCIITTGTLYQQFKNQILATAGMGQVLGSGLPQYAMMGVKQEVLMVDNAVITWDARCPANNVACLDLSVIKWIVSPLYNGQMSKFTDLSTTEGGKFADQAYLQTRFMLTNDNPKLAALFTAIGT